MAQTTDEKISRLQVGDHAPDFTLPTHNEGELNLEWYEGRKHVLLAFYPGDWTPVCSQQIPEYQTRIDEFDRLQCQVLAVSVDSIPCHLAWARSMGGLGFPLMSDYWPHGAVARKYGVFYDRGGYALRSVFLIDKQGIIRYIEHSELTTVPDHDELFRQLALLQD